MKSPYKKNTKFIKSKSNLNNKLKTNNNNHQKLKLDNIYLNSEKYNNYISNENQRNIENIYIKNRYDTEGNVNNYNTEINKGYNQARTETNTPYSQQKIYGSSKMQNQISQRLLTESKTYKLGKIFIDTNKRDSNKNNNAHNNFIINDNYGININKIKIINNSNTNIFGNNNFSFVINDIKNIKNSINRKNNDNDNFIDSSKRCTTTNNDFSNAQINYIYKSNLMNSIDNSDYKNNQKTYNIVNINNNINNNYITNIQNSRNNKNYIKSQLNNNNINTIGNSATNIFINIKTPINNTFNKKENSKNIKIKSNCTYTNNQNKINIIHNKNKTNNNCKSNNTIDTEYINNINYIYRNHLKTEMNNKLINHSNSNYNNTTINSHRNRKQNNINLINSFNNSNIENNIHNKRNLNKIKISIQINSNQGNFKEIKERIKKYHKKKLLKESHQISKNDMKSYFSCKLIKNNDSNIRENSCQNLSKIRSRKDKLVLQYNAPKENKIHERITNTPEYSESKRFLLNKHEIKNYQSAKNINFLSIIISNNQNNLVAQKSEDNLKFITERKNIKAKPECQSVNNIFSKNNINIDKNNKQLNDNICQSNKNSNRYYNFTNKDKDININNNLSERNNRYINTGSHSIKIKDNKISQTFNVNHRLNKTPNHNFKINDNSFKNLNQNISCKELKHKNHSQKDNIRKISINTIDSNKKINNIQTINDTKETIHKINEKLIINNIYNNILYRSIRITSINKKKKNKKQELLNELNRCINFGKNLLNKIPKKECDICHIYIDSHLFKIHYNSHPTEIFKWLYLGTFSNACDIKELRRLKINYILNVANECINKKLPNDIKELHLKIKDSDDFELYIYFDEANEFINKCKTEGNTLLVHCKLGISRSASFIIAYLIKYHKMSVKEALEFVKQKRNQIKPNEGFINQLHEYEKKYKK